jgi:hypothetical protein
MSLSTIIDKKLQALRKKHKTQVAKCKGKVLKKCPNGCGFDHLTVWVSFKKKYLLCPQCGWSSRPIAQAYFKRRGAKL